MIHASLERIDQGFTLSETLVALTVLSLLMLPLSELTSLSIRGVKSNKTGSEKLAELQSELDQWEAAERVLPGDMVISEVPFRKRKSKIEQRDSCRFDLVGRRCR